MALLNDDMSKVPNPTDAVDEGWYHVRISKADVTTSDSTGQPCVKMLMVVQNEGPMLGRTVPDTASLQSHALFKLKGYYSAIGYNPGPEGHDPAKLIDGECYIYVQHDSYQGKPTLKIPPVQHPVVERGSREKCSAQREQLLVWVVIYVVLYATLVITLENHFEKRAQKRRRNKFR